MTIHLDTLDHVALNVTNVKASAAWYAEVLDFEIVHKWPHTDPRYGPVTQAWMIAQRDIRLGLFERQDATHVTDVFERLIYTHVAFRVSKAEFEVVQCHLRDCGIDCGTVEDTGIAKSVFFTDPDGHSLEVTTYYAPGFTSGNE